jgi:transposase-like protein
MPRTRPPYPPAFRTEAVRLIRSGHKPLTEIAKDLGVTDQTALCGESRNLSRADHEI